MTRASARDRFRGINRVPGGAELRAWNGISRVLRAKGNMPHAHDARRTAPADSQFEPNAKFGVDRTWSDLSSPASPRIIAWIPAMRAVDRRNARRSPAPREGSAILDRMTLLDRCRKYDRRAYLATVGERDRAIAARLCAMFEKVFPAKERHLYAGMPVAIRDMEWLAGFAMRSAHPVAYCCAPRALAELRDVLKPYLSGKSCIAVKPRRGETLDDVLSVVDRAFRAASRSGGVISKADLAKRERARAASATTKVKSKAEKKAKKKASAPSPAAARPSGKSRKSR